MRLGATLPRRVSVGGQQRALAELAEVLLQEGILQDDDWLFDSLETSINHGLVRWLNGEMGAGELRRLPLSFHYTDDVVDWLGEFGANVEADQPMGLFGFVATHYMESFVAARVLELNQVQKGLGYQVLSVLNRALGMTVGGATPAWAHWEVTERWEWDMVEADEAEAHDILTPDRFHRVVPLEACKSSYNLRSLKIGRHKCRADWQAAAVREAIGIGELLKTSPDLQCHTYELSDELEQVHPVAVRWSEEDAINRVSDDYHELIANSGFETDLVWTRSFQLGKPDSVRDAARALRPVTELIVRAGRLLDLLHSEEPPQKRVRVRVGAPLVDIFAQEVACGS